MFERFGEFDSAEELNRAAKAQLLEGEKDVIRAIAEENGLDKEDAEDYIDGFVEELTGPLLAAIGKLNVEILDLKNEVDILDDWIMMIRTYCQQEEAFARAVRRKGKSLKGCIEKLMKWSLQHAEPVPKDICKACGISYNVKLGIPGSRKARELIREYYLGEAKG